MGGVGGNELIMDDGVLDFETKSSYTVVVRVTDSGGNTYDETITLTVNDLNEAPTTTGIANQTVNEDAANLLIDLHSAFADPEDADAALTYTIQNVTTPGLFNSVTIDGADNIVFDFAANQHGASQITVRATDTSGLFVETTFQIDVNPVNDNPFVASSVAPVVVNEDAANTLINLSNVFDDVDISTSGDWLTYSIVSNSDPTLATATISGNQLVMDYRANQFGTSTIVVRATDSAGQSVVETINLTVNAVNDAPVVKDHTFTAPDNSSISGNVLSGATDIEGEPLTATLLVGPSSGSVTVNADGTFVYVPNAGFFGSDSFRFVASDGTDISNIGEVIINIPAAPAPTLPEPKTEIETKTEPEPESKLPLTNVSFGEKATEILQERPSVFSGSVIHPHFTSIDEAPEFDVAYIAMRSIPALYHQFSSDYAPALQSMEFVAPSITPTNLLLASLEAFGEDVDQATKKIDFAFVNSIVAMSGISIGVVTWILRSGALLASMMANLPAWRIIDPLTVLGYGKDEEEEDESIQDIVENGAGEAESTDLPDEELSEDSPDFDPSNPLELTNA
jgi:hypothetical protein